MAKLNKLGVENSLWNNIRANKGSGKAPTKEMLKQERKINAKYEEGGTTFIKDNRSIRKTTGKAINPNRDLKTKNYSKETIENLAQSAINNKLNPYTTIAQGLVETGLDAGGEENIGHTLYTDPKLNRGTTQYEDMVYNIKEGNKRALNKGKKSEADIIQGYNGYGKLYPSTEASFHGGKSKAFYGVPIPKNGLDMNTNPLYGKEVMDIRDNVLAKNKSFTNLVNQFQGPTAPISHPKNSFANSISEATRKKITSGRSYNDINNTISAEDRMHLNFLPKLAKGGVVKENKYNKNKPTYKPRFPGKLETNQVDDTYVAPSVSDMRSAVQKKLDYKNYKDNQKLGKSVQNIAVQTTLDQVDIPYKNKNIPIGTMINAANDASSIPSFSNPWIGRLNTSLNTIKSKVPVMGDLAVNTLQEGLQRGDEEYATNDFKAKKYLKEKGIDSKNTGYIKPFAKGGKVPVSAGGEKHLVYRKLSPTGNGEGVKGHIMVNHPTMDKGKWDTIDLTDVADVNTVNQGIAATKKWHAENPEYGMGGYAMYGNGGVNNPGFKALPENIQKKILAKMAMGGKLGYNEYVPEFVSKEPSPLPRFNKGGSWNGTDASGKAIKTNFAGSTAGENVVTGAGIAGAAVPMLTSFIPDDRITDSEGNEVGYKEDMGKSILNSAAQGASMGAVAGPWGVAIGAGVGAIYGGVTNSMNNDAVDKAQQQANMRIQNRNISNSVLTNKGMYSTNTSNNDQMIAARGGTVINEDMGNPNAELELNETFRDPMTGETGMVNGPSHDDGGIEMSLAEGTQIWSDRLKHNGRTFASLTKPIINKIAVLEKGTEDNPNSRFKQNSIKLLNAQLDFFFDIQESNKQQDEMKRTLKKQEGGVVDDMGNYHYANGGIYIKPENRGKFTAYKERTGNTTEEALHSPDPHVRQMANFAKNAAGWKHAMGGMVQYDGGGTKDNIGINDGQGRTVVGQINPFTGKPYTVADASNSNFISRGFMDRSPFTKLGPVSYVGNEGNTLLYGKQRPTSFGKPDAPRTMGPMNRPQGYQEPIANQMGPMNRPAGYVDPIQPMQTVENMPAGYDPNAALKRSIKPYYNNADNNYDAAPPVEPQTEEMFKGTMPVDMNGLRNAQGEYENLVKLRAAQGEYENQPFTPDIVETAPRSINQSKVRRNNTGELIQAGALAGSTFAQLNNINRQAAPGIRPDVRLTGAIPNPRYVDLSAERGAINRSALGAMGDAQRGFGNSATAQAFKNKARINQLEGLGKSFSNQEIANADIGNKFAGMRGDAAMKEAMMNNEIANTNLENKYQFNQNRMANQNAAIGTLGHGVGDIGRNRTNFSNDMEKANVLSNQYESSVLADTYKRNPQLLEDAWNSGQISKNAYDKYKTQPQAKYGGTIKKRSLKY